MPSLSLAIPHSLGQEVAQQRLQSLLTKALERNQSKISNLEQATEGNRQTFKFSTFGFKVSGDVVVEAAQIVLNVSLPFAAMMFKGKIEQTLREEITKALAAP